MALNLTTLLPAKINTSEIATKYDVSSSIAAYNPANYINANTTTINGGKITTGSITAGQIAANTITTSNLSTNIGLVNGYVYSSNFNGNVSGNIGTPTAGFRLSSTAAGTSADPTIYGAYIKGGTVKGAIIDGATLIGEVLSVNNMKMNNSSYPLNTGNFFISKNISLIDIGYSLSETSAPFRIVSESYGSGFMSNRAVATSKIISFTFTAFGGDAPILKFSIDGGAYYNAFIPNLAYYSSVDIPVTFISTLDIVLYQNNNSVESYASSSVSIKMYNFNHN